MTRYSRQCPRCKHTHFDETKSVGNTAGVLSTTTATVNQPIAMGPQWPRIVYDLQGILGASSPENGLAKAYELVRRLLPYKYKYNVDSPETVFDLLEKKAVDGIRRAAEAEQRLQRMFNDPILIFYETVGADLAAADWYEASKREGYAKDFLTFLSETIEKHFEKQGYELEIRENPP